MSGNSDLVDKLKIDLDTIIDSSKGGLALLTSGGKIVYSDLAEDVEEKLMLFKPSFPGLIMGSNITIAAKNGSIIVMRVSEKTLMAVQTEQNVSTSLGKISTVAKRYKEEFDNYPQTTVIKPTEVRSEAVVEEVVEEVEKELTEQEFEDYQKSLVYELIPPLTPDNVISACSFVWRKTTRLMLRNLDQDLTVDELREGLNGAGFDVSLQWVLENLQSLASRGIVRIKEK